MIAVLEFGVAVRRWSAPTGRFGRRLGCGRSSRLTGELALNGLPYGVCWHELGGDALGLTAEVGDPAQLPEFIAALGAAGKMILLRGGQRIVNAQCAIGEPIGTQVGHDVTSAS
jgi:hypothetical protein